MNEQHAEYTITEEWHPNQSRVYWTARQGHRVVTKVECPMVRGMVDSDVLRAALSAAEGISPQSVRFVRKKSDAGRIVPRIARVIKEGE